MIGIPSSSDGTDHSSSVEAVPFSCYSGSFKTWSFENDIIPDLEKSEADDEEFLVEQEEFISEQSRYQTPEHFSIGKSPDIDYTVHHEGRTFADCSVQTELQLSLTAADIMWTPTIETRADHEVASSTGDPIGIARGSGVVFVPQVEAPASSIGDPIGSGDVFVPHVEADDL